MLEFDSFINEYNQNYLYFQGSSSIIIAPPLFFQLYNIKWGDSHRSDVAYSTIGQMEFRTGLPLLNKQKRYFRRDLTLSAVFDSI